MGVRHFAGLGAQAEAVGVIDRQTAHNASLVARIEWASFVYLSGACASLGFAVIGFALEQIINLEFCVARFRIIGLSLIGYVRGRARK